MFKNVLLWVVIAVVLMSVFNNFGSRTGQNNAALSYSQFIDAVKSGQVQNVILDDENGIKGQLQSGERFTSYAPNDPHLIDDLLASGVEIKAQAATEESMLMQIFISWFPMLLLIGVWVFFMRQMQGGAGGKGGPMSFGKSKARMLEEDQIKVTFADVAGCDEAKEEVEEMVDFLKDPAKYQKLGGKIPRGALMVGPPGTGKTLLARAIAGEAKVPFFTISGSDFVEMFVGVGASRVRDMFEQAKRHSPCIIFIDEIDAVGRQRGAGLGGGNDEREQTLNQLLVEMDGFEGNEGVIVIAATNRPDVLDAALLRPGRFDRQVTVSLPDVKGRERILGVHMAKVPAADDVQIKYIAQGTPGFSGADLANLVNEAALYAARMDKRMVSMFDLEKAKDKLIMGAEKRSMVMDPKEKKMTAYHEAGHAIVGKIVPEHDPVYKVSIMPRGRALGVTMFLPEKDQYSASKCKLDSMISSLYGGRIAEAQIFGGEQVSTGASNDIERATELARNMVTKWGFSQRLGPLAYSEEEGEVFLGRSVTQHKSVADETSHTIDEEIRSIIDKNYERAEKILKDNEDILHTMSDALMKYETIDKDQIEDLMARRPVREPQGWDDTEPPNQGVKVEDAVEAKETETPKANAAEQN
ncbi:cell division protease FtsH [Bathymodiolus platifrons methanotrophic gill symbiont]|uniref:ATP-dependent zinc metalloprotease FtsH n=1 Tax=Bathymodiolus platifrons methanotrophic gill symbiont TaxID=113268 RepID=UPI00157DB237|nr:ATP-dependent zinc metalloprotease FtsH [Bathymodiolus platifrons methanotrophic gill symbiont]MCK5870801.1 ATP-dependent zinc metalloprotease FtsH [Methyloprofundus sp.]GFO74884.1 cell division protease FtsH [Bathymodiolus platifrons methanotrophic gill symbiont]